jgi:hypothetical protein
MYPKTLTIDVAYQCGHKPLRLTKTLLNEDEQVDFYCETCNYKANLCPDCKEQNALKYREVYAAIKNPHYNGYNILFKRPSPLWSGSMLFVERLDNWDTDVDGDGYRTTKFLVEYDINHNEHKPVGLNKGDHFVPFSGYTVEYMKLLLHHDREVKEAEAKLLEANLMEETNRMKQIGWGI